MRGNPLQKYLDDQLYHLLLKRGFLNERAIRDLYIKNRYGQLKEEARPKEIFQIIQEEFSYLSVETIRKIIYSKKCFQSNGCL
jgi:hypothetical protein